MEKANQDIRQYMEDHGVLQRDLGDRLGVTQQCIGHRLSKELPQNEKAYYLNLIDAIVADRVEIQSEGLVYEIEPTLQDENSSETKFKIGDRVKIPSKANKTGTINDIWSSLAKAMIMYAVENDDDGYCGMYAEDQLEPAPLPVEYSFETSIDSNVAVVVMNAKQGEKTWVYARGHAHILHDGEVGIAQAVSYAAKRMFEALDTKQENKIYFKD